MKLLAAAAVLLAGATVLKVPPAEPPQAVNDAVVLGEGIPASLAEFKFFADLRAQQPVARVEPYRLQTPLWSDGAEKLRFMYIPAGKQALAQREGLLGLPVGSALIKTFKMQGRLIETRVLLHRVDGWVALPYQWNAEQTEARLVLAGARLELTTPQGQAISYAIPNKNQCKECHALNGAVTPIGPKARNLSASWLAFQNRIGRLDSVPKVAARLPLWEERARFSLAAAARGYLDANCAHCHNPGGSASNSGLDLRWEQQTPVSYGVYKRPTAAGRGSGGLEFDIKPGDPDGSILIHRMESLEGGVAMPEIGRSSHDREGEALVRSWIAGMK
jgi:uncharacterized repeat protein (TIGR03806 family)